MWWAVPSTGPSTTSLSAQGRGAFPGVEDLCNARGNSLVLERGGVAREPDVTAKTRVIRGNERKKVRLSAGFLTLARRVPLTPPPPPPHESLRRGDTSGDRRGLFGRRAVTCGDLERQKVTTSDRSVDAGSLWVTTSDHSVTRATLGASKGRKLRQKTA